MTQIVELPGIESERTAAATPARWSDLRHLGYGLSPLVILGLLAFVMAFDAQGFTVLLPNITQDIRTDVSTILNVAAFTTAIGLVATVAIGWYADRHHRVSLLGIGSILSGITGMLSARATGTAGIALPRGGGKVSSAAATVPLISLLADYYPSRARGRVFALFGAVTTLGGIVSVVLVAVMGSAWGWRAAVVVSAVPAIVIGVVAMVMLREPVRGYYERRDHGLDETESRRQDPPHSFGEAWRTTFASRTLKRLFVADMIQQCASVAVVVFLPFLLSQEYGLDTLQRGLVVLPSVLASVAGGFVGGRLIDTLSRRSPSTVVRVTAAFGLLAAPGIAILALTPPLWLLIVSVFIVFFGLSLVGPPLGSVYSQVIPPAVRTQGLQVMNLATIPALLFLVLAGTTIQRDYGYAPLFLIAVACIAIGSVVQITAADYFDLDRHNATVAVAATQEYRRRRSSGSDVLLACRGVNVGYETTQVLFGVDFEVRAGEIVALLGTNGAGKSTLLRAISGSQQAWDGAILFEGRDITHKPPHEVTRLGVVHMPGGRGVFPGLSVDENLRLGTWLSDSAHRPALLAEAYELFPVLHARASQPAGLLSGGEQQMLSLAQAFMATPRLLLIDELSLGLSPAVVGQLLDVIKQINARGTAVIVVEQSVNVALSIAQRAVFMEKGEVKFSGPTEELMQRPDILRAVYVKGTGGLTATGAPSSAAQRRHAAGLDAARPILQVDSVAKRFGGVTALDGASLSLREGEILGIIGPNGSGKTTLFDIISGYQQPDEGRVVYDGVDVTALPAHERARRKLVRRFQDARLFPSLTVFEALLVALDMRLEVRSAAMGAMALPPVRRAERRARQRAERLIELLELGAYRDKFVKELSTGLRRIVDLAFALALEPRVLLMDEPSSGIAQAEAEGLGPLVKRIRFETGCSILIIEHDMPLITAVSDEMVAMVAGRPVVRGSASEVLGDPRVVAAFLGESEAAISRSGSLV